MIKKPFIALKKTGFEYAALDRMAKTSIIHIALPEKVTLLSKIPFDPEKPLAVKTGDPVKTGQRIIISDEPGHELISTVTGTISSVSSYRGSMGQSYTAVSIVVNPEDDLDKAFKNESKEPTLNTAAAFLSSAPGEPPFDLFQDPEKPINKIVIYGGDSDLLLTTGQYLVTKEMEALKAGIGVLKKITGVESIILAIPLERLQGYGHIGAEAKFIDPAYPSAHPQLIMANVLRQVVPAGQRCEDLGVCFMRAEAAVSIGSAFENRSIPVTTAITVVDKNGKPQLIRARIGTPISDIFKALKIALVEKDRIILGGPMTGFTVYSDDHPILPDTDAIMVQDRSDIVPSANAPCTNCGECIRICPVNIPINMLVRYLEKGLFEEAAEEYDLLSCIECGLCSYVCVSRIPVLQHIRLAKHELARVNTAEAVNE